MYLVKVRRKKYFTGKCESKTFTFHSRFGDISEFTKQLKDDLLEYQILSLSIRWRNEKHH